MGSSDKQDENSDEYTDSMFELSDDEDAEPTNDNVKCKPEQTDKMDEIRQTFRKNIFGGLGQIFILLPLLYSLIIFIFI